MSPQGEEETHSLEGLRQCLHSVDGILQDLLEETTKNQSSPMQIPNYSSRLSELESQKAEILSELERMKLEKESFQESLKSPIKEDYHFLVSDRVELQSKLGDLNLRLNELESLLEDKNHEIVAKDVERQEFMERFQRYETEKNQCSASGPST
ncbi:unnamed protein product [Lepeophtheirus salmonis]|uniref:(salmon louse) hypothetical protein n=1 Tax=Lepeophtheirus salmonis TaxID=72036 RepID=A0A7R8D417_LEPSM|nr:unnamed protein product [Lepeophtheirus salmonis]CAF3021644.1 unnamed protein product [Lepeophtheirus salmonis]